MWRFQEGLTGFGVRQGRWRLHELDEGVGVFGEVLAQKFAE